MENASKALVMAGGILLTILVISLFLYTWTAFSEYQANQDSIKEVQKIAEFNAQFANYNRNDVQGYELLSLVNKVIDYNQRYSSEFDSNKSAGNSAQYRPFTLSIKLDESSSDYTNRNKFTTSITVPAVAKSAYQNKLYNEIQTNSARSNPIEKKYNGADYRIFDNYEYKQSNTSNKFANILNTINSIEANFGGITNAQELVKSSSTIFESKIFNYNGQPINDMDKRNWYRTDYIISRYKTLTGINASSINDIRNEENVKNALKYFEYIEFKKAEFECTKVKYHNDTARIIEMSFEIKE